MRIRMIQLAGILPPWALFSIWHTELPWEITQAQEAWPAFPFFLASLLLQWGVFIQGIFAFIVTLRQIILCGRLCVRRLIWLLLGSRYLALQNVSASFFHWVVRLPLLKSFLVYFHISVLGWILTINRLGL